MDEKLRQQLQELLMARNPNLKLTASGELRFVEPPDTFPKPENYVKA